MSCLDKRHVSQGGGMQGHYKYTDGFSDTSSVGSFMDDTDREVSSLTDRAFRSLCIGDEAVYNDSEFASSPVEAFSLDTQNMNILKFTAQEAFSLGVKQNGGGAEGEAAVGATFQQSILDIAKKGLTNDYVPHSSNGAIETSWQQNSSTSKYSSGGTTRDGHQSGQSKVMKDLNHKNSSSSELWEKSILLDIQGELSEASAAGHESLKGGHFNETENHFHCSRETVNKDVETPSAKPSKSKRGKSSKVRKPSSKNFFLHSEHSPFESWRDCNRYLFEQNHTPDPLSTNERPKWYDSPLYKELTAEHGLRVPESKESKLHQRKTEDVASAMEKRSESESGAVCPPWRRRRNLARGTLPGSRPSTVAPCGRSEEASMDRASGAVTVVTPIGTLTAVTAADEPASNSSTPFNISQLLTPVIHARQGTETSEVLQSALSPAGLDLDLSPSAFAETAAKPANEVKLRNNYKAIASSLLFNLKDNRKRVKSTYSPTKFKTADLSKQLSKPEAAVPKNAPAISEVPVTEASSSQPKASNVRPCGAISNGESETDAKGRSVTSPVRESTPCKAESATSPANLDEGGWVRCLIESAKSQTPGPRSNSSSPSPIRPILFKVKDNTFRSSPLTKTVKAPLHRSFSDDFRLSSPRDSWSGSEKGEDERGRLKERGEVCSPREASTSRWGPHFRATPVKSPTVQPVAVKESRSKEHQRRNPCQEEEESHSAISTVPEEVEDHAASAADIAEERATGFLHPEEPEGSKEPSEKSESVCSAGETQPLGKPPPVLPKTEKALRRAKRLTTKRIKKAEAGSKLESKSRAGPKPVRERQIERPPAAERLPSQPGHNPPHAPQFYPEPDATPAPQNTVTQSFPLTQRKLLQDPDSGQYFMVNMPMQVLASQTPASEAVTKRLENSVPEEAGLPHALSSEADTNIEPACVSHDYLPERPLYVEDKDSMNSINAMSESELDKFTVGHM
ncbi:hypothetical protein AAFF_G00332650 [Aldrovandia affinis]|uniref:DUF4585 domain-containing protein n=1 Tax=Aldrovandia affinis TaxID=143900 RepID=A0AAD7WQ44_9TELE|nr:hypothetical protein AAFF_G00332650 [Aldrovandia affinis]